MIDTLNTAIELIKEFEGFSAKPYLCPAGVPTIGYGSTTGVKLTDEPITEEQALEMLRADLAVSITNLRALVGKNLNQFQEAALLSFIYNLGFSAFQNSTLMTMIGENPCEPYILDQFLRWNKVRTKAWLIPSIGLSRRRLAEAILYFKKA